ncbi:zf-HC2 domain-containing protein [Streptomyces sp. J2-1]|uniref:zf-HC2 domain-containing protein n=1 Tax=Streptomyces corallincola TaxID=2851888 RepID=UPI001C3945C4|nr:zf-HC2 domain-containing protein [Streptomyces corallincola]MBV2357381.1 zf-HC2 domain-containing protein [Streptomyces corallincola]
MNDDSFDHTRVQQLLGAWALSACSPEEHKQVDAHLTGCAECTAEADQLRSAVDLLHPHMDLDLPPGLRAEVIGACLSTRRPEVSVPEYAQPYDAETARLDALLADLTGDEWSAPVQLKWMQDEDTATRDTTVAGVLGHLLAVDGMVAKSLGLPDPAAPAEDGTTDPRERTEALWQQIAQGTAGEGAPDLDSMREVWRDHAYELIRTCSFAGGGVADIAVPYGDGVMLPLRLALLDRAFETWIHATDIADAVDYPYTPPVPDHLRTLISVAVQMLPSILAARRQAGLASPPLPLIEPGAEARSLRLRIEGESGGDWYLPLDGPDGPAGPENCVGHVVLDEVDFCRLAAGHLAPRHAAAGQEGDSTAAAELLYAITSMSRL